MARKLSRIAEFGFIWLTFFAPAMTASRALAQSEVVVSPAPGVVENPFSSRRSPARPAAVAAEAANEPKSYQNPFAARPARPQLTTPRPTSGSLSRWRRPVELPGARLTEIATPASTTTSNDSWDTLAPDMLEIARGPIVGPVAKPHAAPASLAVVANGPPTAAAPPDPVRFAPSSLHQPYWLLPEPKAGEPMAPEPSAPVAFDNPHPPIDFPPAAPPRTSRPVIEAPIVNAPMADPFEEPAGEFVTISDAEPAAPAPRDAAACYAEAEHSASTAATIEELGLVVHLCESGLARRPQGELARSLRTLAAWAANRRGEMKSDDRREDEALREFELAIQFDPNCWLALHNRGVSRAQQGKANEALQDFNRAIDLNPGHSVAYRNRGELLAAIGRTDEAVADYTRSLAQLPDDPNVLLMRGHSLHRLGRYEDSLADLSRAIQLAPQNAEALAHRGNVYAELGQFSLAIRDFQQSLRLDAESPDAYRSLAWLMATCPDPRYRDPQQALAAAQRAANLAPPGDCFVLDALAAAHANAGQFEQATRYQREAVAFAPADFQASFSDRLALYQSRRPFRNGSTRATDTGVRAASLEAASRQQ